MSELSSLQSYSRTRDKKRLEVYSRRIQLIINERASESEKSEEVELKKRESKPVVTNARLACLGGWRRRFSRFLGADGLSNPFLFR